MLCPNCSPSQPLTYPLSVNAQKVLRLMQSSDYNTASRLKIEAELSRELEEVMGGYLKYLLEREVKSVAWLDTLREQTKQLIPNRSALL
jgi:DNA repair protein RecO (recombination protein O)